MNKEGRSILNFKFQISKKGFTLTEIVLLLSVVGIIISGVLPLFLNVITANKSSHYYAVAYKALDSKIEVLRNTAFDSVTSTTYSIPELPNGEAVLEVTNNIEGLNQPDIKLLDLKIRWNFKKQNEVKISTYLSRKGLRK